MSDRRSHDPYAPPPRDPAEAHTVLQTLAGVAHTTNDPADAVEPGRVGDRPVDMLPNDLDDITKPDLIALAELAGVATYGTKQDIADRIRAAA